ncbi:hypothetical protein ACE1OC_00270 [Streptomyces sp. DSM 116496]|uniref:hypothetical protein n=1 Tax=Streptomyces stoeckheimensis TaxID=3344656 RepID=UPI0038B34BDB
MAEAVVYPEIGPGCTWTDQVRAAAAGFARRHQRADGLWNTWLSHDDTPAPDVVAHMSAGIEAAALPGIDLTLARTWLAALGAGGHWNSDWYVPPPPTARPRSAPPLTHTSRTTPT